MNEFQEDSIGRVFLGRYRVVLQLGRGGQGAVYLARGEGAEGFARPVVVKRILAPLARNQNILEQFAREARITAQLRHPAIVPIIDFAIDRDAHVMVLEYVHGYDLRRWERFVRRVRGHFPPAHVLYPLLRILDALQYAHSLRAANGTPRGVTHRDISPANVLIDVEGHVKLTDFGIARMADEELTVDTGTLRIKGKLPYLAPEMFQGERASKRTDLYACGVVLHELLIGRNEFLASTAAESMACVTGHIPTRLDRVRPDLPEALADVAERALAKDPDERFQSAQDFASALRAAFYMSEVEMAELFRRAVHDDFHDPRLAEMTGAHILNDLDRAWRTARTVVTPNQPVRGTPETAVQSETQLDLGDIIGEAPARSRVSLAPRHGDPASPAKVPLPSARALGIFAVCAVLALTAAWLFRSQASTAPRFVYVEREDVSATSESGVETARQAPSHAAEQATHAAQPTDPVLTATVSKTPKPASPERQAERLTQAFARHRAEVAACFAQHREAVQGTSSLHVQFAIGTNGRVRSASLVPDNLTLTPFGRCVTRIAGATEFDVQPTPLTFRIPITALEK